MDNVIWLTLFGALIGAIYGIVLVFKNKKQSFKALLNNLKKDLPKINR